MAANLAFAATIEEGLAQDRRARPGRLCPVAYRYAPRVFDRPPELVADTIYVVGGLYGNVEALDAVQAMAASEDAPLVLNGDFHWFDVCADDFAAVEAGVAHHLRLRGNVETEIADEDRGAGCGCAYPLDVSDAEVARSNAILDRLRATARGFPAERERLRALPMHLVAQVGECRVGIVHGDAASLAGWGFAHDQLDDPGHARWIESVFNDARVEVFAATHTCLAAFRRFDFGPDTRLVANNGAAGMPNFAGTRYGLVTRISTRPRADALYRMALGDVHVEAIRLRFDNEPWMRRFLGAWPAGSAGHVSYFRRMSEGPRFTPADAAPRRTRAA